MVYIIASAILNYVGVLGTVIEPAPRHIFESANALGHTIHFLRWKIQWVYSFVFVFVIKWWSKMVRRALMLSQVKLGLNSGTGIGSALAWVMLPLWASVDYV